jgi:hypothetical protein
MPIVVVFVVPADFVKLQLVQEMAGFTMQIECSGIWYEFSLGDGCCICILVMRHVIRGRLWITVREAH